MYSSIKHNSGPTIAPSDCLPPPPPGGGAKQRGRSRLGSNYIYTLIHNYIEDIKQVTLKLGKCVTWYPETAVYTLWSNTIGKAR